MSRVNHHLPYLLSHSDVEIINTERAQLHDFVVDLVSTLSWDLDLHGQILDLDGLNASRDEPQTRSSTLNNRRIDIDSAYSQNNCIGPIFKWEIFNSESINWGSVNGLNFNIINM